jgi:hypothetical protein
MNEKIQQILHQINTLEDEIQAELNEQKKRWLYQVHGKGIEFERSMSDVHRTIKMGVFRWFLTVRPLNYLTAPIVYSMIFPILLLDLSMFIYQWTCFPIYRITRVRRSDYITFDHRHLAYLNIIEKINCLYCSYGNGLMAYVTEIFARTEQYFCPIKHAQRMKGMHDRYQYFLDYGDAENLHKKLEEVRASLIHEVDKPKND